MQAPIADEVNCGAYNCVHNRSGGMTNGSCYLTDPTSQQNLEVDCGKLALCLMGPCRCDAHGCSVTMVPEVQFDLALVPPNADGSVSGLDSAGVRNAHFTKQ